MRSPWRSFATTMAVAALVIGLAWSVPAVLAILGYRFYLNTTPSVPTGIYIVRVGRLPTSREDMFTFYPPAHAAQILYGRGWLAPGAPLTKQSAGLPGDRYCVDAGQVSVRGVRLSHVYEQDRTGFRLVHPQGCSTLSQGQFLPLGLNAPNSYDGRYFGPVDQASIVGTAKLILALPAGHP